jgi:5-methyltetrahydrofolate--homocysteine methyltransferase
LVTLDWSGLSSDGVPADEVARRAFDAGAQVVLFEIPGVEVGLGWVDPLLAVCAASRRHSGHDGGRPPIGSDGATPHLGFALAAGTLDPDAWAHETRRLLEADVRVVGGGRGTTQRHLAALSGLLRGHDRQTLWPPPAPRAV